MVQRTLRWLIHQPHDCVSLSSEAFCEAVSIHLGDESRDSEAIADKSEILRHCRSLIRLSVEGTYFEFAHFSVLEFLQGLKDRGDMEFRSFHVDSKQGPTELCKTCLTYLNFREFDQGGDGSLQITQNRLEKYPFREFAVCSWSILAQDGDWEDHDLISQITAFLNPSKPGTLISWAQDYFVSARHRETFSIDKNSDFIMAMNRGISEATALHFAALLHLSKACKWLVEAGCDVRQRSTLGTPLHFALLETSVLTGRHHTPQDKLETRFKKKEAIDVLLKAGADPNDKHQGIDDVISPLFLATVSENNTFMNQLLEHGAIVDDDCWESVRTIGFHEAVSYILQNAKFITLNEVAQVEAWRAVLMAQDTPFSDLLPSHLADNGIPKKKELLHVAAEYGQFGAVLELVEKFGVDVDSPRSSDRRTALHIACERDHIDVVKILINHGAKPLRKDQHGRTALHYARCNKNGRSFSYLLDCAFESSSKDNSGLTPWHCVSRSEYIATIKLLQDHEEVRKALQRQEEVGSSNLSLISCAAQSGSKEAISILLDLGFSPMVLDKDCCTALHHAARAGSPEVVRTLISQGVDVKAISSDGSSAIHYVTDLRQSKSEEVVQTLLDQGANPFAPRNDGDTFLDFVLNYEEGRWPSSELKEIVENALNTLARVADSFKCKNEVFSLALHKNLRAPQGLRLRCLEVIVDFEIDLSQKSPDGDVTLLEALLEARKIMAAKPKQYAISSRQLDPKLSHMLQRIPCNGPLHEICARPIYLLNVLEIGGGDLACEPLDHVANVDDYVEEKKISPIEAACGSVCSRAIII